jgi:hypothetical protein
VVEAVVEREGKLTAKGIKDEYKIVHKETYDVSDAEQYASMAIRQLERIRDDDKNAKRELTRVINWTQERMKDL